MEAYVYKCKTCGMTRQVPAYWTGYVKEPVTEFPHMQIETKQMCETIELDFVGEIENEQI